MRIVIDTDDLPADASKLDLVLVALAELKLGFAKMTKEIDDFNAAMTTFFDRQDVAVTDLQGDVKSLSDQIAALQASATGTLSSSDQALLDALAARAQAITAKLDALDALTPPTGP